MNNLKLLTALAAFLLSVNNHSFGQETTGTSQRSMAVLLGIQGKGHFINAIDVSLIKVYDGRAKMFNDKYSVKTDDVLKIKATDEKGRVIYEGYYDNPLVEVKETFEEGGMIARNDLIVSTTGCINVRFPLQYAPGNITLSCFQVIDEQEKLLKTIPLNR